MRLVVAATAPVRVQAVKKAMTPDVKLVIIESPTNPRLQARGQGTRHQSMHSPDFFPFPSLVALGSLSSDPCRPCVRG